MFVSKSQAKTMRGHLLGFVMNSAVSILGAKYIINDMSKNGRDDILAKAVLAGEYCVFYVERMKLDMDGRGYFSLPYINNEVRKGRTTKPSFLFY